MVENGKIEKKWISSTAREQEEDHDSVEKLKHLIDEREDKDVNGENGEKKENAEWHENEGKGESGYKGGTLNGQNEEEESQHVGQDEEEEEDNDYENEVQSKANWLDQVSPKDEDDRNGNEIGDGRDDRDHLGKGMDEKKTMSNFLKNDEAFGEDEQETQPAKKKVKGLGHAVCFE